MIRIFACGNFPLIDFLLYFLSNVVATVSGILLEHLPLETLAFLL